MADGEQVREASRAYLAGVEAGKAIGRGGILALIQKAERREAEFISEHGGDPYRWQLLRNMCLAIEGGAGEGG